MRRNRLTVFAGTVLMVVLALSAASTSGADTHAAAAGATVAPACACKPMGITVTPPGQAASRATDGIAIQNFAYVNSTLTVNVGDTVTWTNSDSATHTATSDSGVFDTGALATGKSASFTFTKAGTFPYHCSIHPFMTATITVAGTSAGGELSGTWAGSVKGKVYSIASTKVRSENEAISFVFTQTGGTLTATVTLANSTTFNATGQEGNANVWLLGHSETQTLVFSGHLDKKGSSISGKGIVYDATGDQEISVNAKKQ